MANDVQITRNGIEAPLSSLAPVSGKATLDCVMQLDKSGQVVALTAYYYSSPVSLVSVQPGVAAGTSLVQLRDLNTGAMQIHVVAEVLAADLVAGSEGIAVLGWNRRLCHFIPYR